MGTADNVRAVEQIARQLQTKNPDLMFVLDPVMGDDGALYVAPELIDLYRDVLCPLAQMVMPNQYEAELLSGIKIESLEDAKRACLRLHELGVPNVVITSAQIPSEAGWLYLIGSEESSGRQFAIKFPRLEGYFTGSGDFFAALTMARYQSLEDMKAGRLARACELAIATQVGVMEATVNYQKSTGVEVTSQNLVRGSRPSAMVRGFELRIIPSQHLIVSPTNIYNSLAI